MVRTKTGKKVIRAGWGEPGGQ